MIDASIPLSGKQPNIMTAQDVMGLKQVMQQSEMNALAIDQKRRQEQSQVQLQAVMKDPQNVDASTGLLNPRGIQAVSAIDPEKGFSLAEMNQQAMSRRAADSLKKLQITSEQNGLLSQSMTGLYASYQANSKRLPTQQASQMFMTELSKTLDEMEKSGNFSPQQLAPFRRIQTPEGALSVIAGTQAYKDFAQSQRQEDTRTPFMKEIEARYGKDSPEYKKALEARIKRESAPTPAMSLTGEGAMSPEAMTLAVDQYLAGDSTAAQGYARNAAMKAAFQNRLAERAKEKGMSGADVAAKVAEFQGVKAGQRSLGTRQATVDMAVTEALNVMPIALKLSEKVDRTSYPTLNSILLAAQKGTGGEDVAQFAASVNALVNIYSRAISPTGTPTVSDKDHAREIISTAYSKGQFSAVSDLMKQEMKAAQSAPGQVREDLSREVSGRKKEAPAKAIEYLKSHPELKEQFKAKYGYVPD